MPSSNTIGEFEIASDIGKVSISGQSQYNFKKAQYRITGSGANIWHQTDAFHFLARKISGDLKFSADITWIGQGQNAHRKACLMVRQSTEHDAPYLDVAVHGDGLIEMQYRTEKGATTLHAITPIKAPTTVKLERDGDVFTISAKKGNAFQPVGAISLSLPDPVLVGLAVCSHDNAVSETALFSNVTLTHREPKAEEKRVQETSLEILDIATGERTCIYRALQRFEAPNWSLDGTTLIINQGGLIYTLPAEGGEPKKLDTGQATRCNNDHGLSPDGTLLAISSSTEKGSQIYILSASGGTPKLITPEAPSYWHGWSPDGKTLAYCAKRNDQYNIFTIPITGGEETQLTHTSTHDDGCDYTPDGQYIYWNADRTGLMKIWRMKPDGSQQEQVTTDTDYADWFPHPSPDGKWLILLSFDKSVSGHPTNKNVWLRLMPLNQKDAKPKVIATLFGGQGTINVPSWSPDSTRVAFVSYRHLLP